MSPQHYSSLLSRASYNWQMVCAQHKPFLKLCWGTCDSLLWVLDRFLCWLNSGMGIWALTLRWEYSANIDEKPLFFFLPPVPFFVFAPFSLRPSLLSSSKTTRCCPINGRYSFRCQHCHSWTRDDYMQGPFIIPFSLLYTFLSPVHTLCVKTHAI